MARWTCPSDMNDITLVHLAFGDGTKENLVAGPVFDRMMRGTSDGSPAQVSRWLAQEGRVRALSSFVHGYPGSMITESTIKLMADVRRSSIESAIDQFYETVAYLDQGTLAGVQQPQKATEPMSAPLRSGSK